MLPLRITVKPGASPLLRADASAIFPFILDILISSESAQHQYRTILTWKIETIPYQDTVEETFRLVYSASISKTQPRIPTLATTSSIPLLPNL